MYDGQQLKLAEHVNLPFKMGARLVLPNLQTNVFAVVPQDDLDKQMDNKIFIWDNSSKSIYQELQSGSRVINLFFTVKKWLLVHTEDSVEGFNLERQFKKQVLIEERFQSSALAILG